MSQDDNGNGNGINHRTRITLGFAIVLVPLVVWAAKADNRVENLEKDRAELRADIRDLNRKMDRILNSLPPKWSNPSTP